MILVARKEPGKRAKFVKKLPDQKSGFVLKHVQFSTMNTMQLKHMYCCALGTHHDSGLANILKPH